MIHTPVLRESAIERTICDLLRAEGWRVFHMEQQWSEKKRKTVGENGMPDVLAIRYNGCLKSPPTGEAQVLWIELKRTVRGRATKAAPHQRDWHRDERARGALTLIAGEDFPASIEGFVSWYKASGLMRRAA